MSTSKDSTQNASTTESPSPDYKRAYEIQKKAREIAERRLEDKSRELYVKNKSLEQALEALNKQQEQLIAQEKLASIGQLAAGLAHELNNPNAFIQNNLITLKEYVEQLLVGIDSSLNIIKTIEDHSRDAPLKVDLANKRQTISTTAEVDFIKSDLPNIFDESMKGTKRIENIANSLRYFANPDLSSMKSFDVNESIRQAKQLISGQHLQAVEINLELSDLPNITGVPLLLSQAIANILLNGAEAEPKSGSVKVTSTLENDHVVLQIKDDGKGISSTRLANIFHPFVSGENTKNGLGLSIAQNIISQHNGRISIESQEGQGTIVTIELPLGKD